MLNAKFQRTLLLGTIEALYRALESQGHKPPWKLVEVESFDLDDLTAVERTLRDLVRTIPNG